MLDQTILICTGGLTPLKDHLHRFELIGTADVVGERSKGLNEQNNDNSTHVIKY